MLLHKIKLGTTLHRIRQIRILLRILQNPLIRLKIRPLIFRTQQLHRINLHKISLFPLIKRRTQRLILHNSSLILRSVILQHRILLLAIVLPRILLTQIQHQTVLKSIIRLRLTPRRILLFQLTPHRILLIQIIRRRISLFQLIRRRIPLFQPIRRRTLLRIIQHRIKQRMRQFQAM